MGLNIGELTGYLDLDDSGFDTGLDAAMSKLSDFGGKFPKVAGAAGAAAAVALSAGLMAADAEATTDKLAAQLGLTEKESERVGGVAGRLYANAYGGSLEEVNDAVGAVMSSIGGMRNASNAQLESMTAKVLDFATAFEVDVTRAAQIAGQMVSSGLARNGSHAMDLLTASMQRVPAAVREDLMDAVDEYGPFMQSIGIKGQEAMQLLVNGAEKGMYGIDKTGDALKEFTIRATDMSAATKTAYGTLGMDAEAMTNKLLAGGQKGARAFDQIVKGLLSIDNPAKQSQAALALFGTPLEDLSVTEMPKFLRSLQATGGGLGKVAGAAARMGKTLNDNAKTNLTSFGRQAKMAFIDVLGGAVLPALNAVASTLAASFGPALSMIGAVLGATVVPALQWLVELLTENQWILQAVAVVIMARLVPAWARAAAAAVASGARQVAAWVSLNAMALRAVAAQVAAMVRMGARWAWLGAKSLLHAAKVAAAWLIAMGPVGIVIAIVIGLVALIIKYWDKIKAVTVKVFKAVWSWLKGVWQDIKGVVSNGVQAAKDAVGRLADIPGRVRDWFGNAKDAVVEKLSAAVSWVRSLPGKFMAGLSAIGNLAGKFRDWFGNAKTAAVDKLGQLLSWVKGIPGKIKSAVGDLGSLLFNAGKSIINGLLDGIESMIGAVKDKLGGLTSMIPDLKGPMEVDAKLLEPNGRAIMQSLVDGFTRGIPMVERTLQGLTGRLPAMAGTPQMVERRTIIERQGPLIGNVHQAPGEDANQLAERLWFTTRTRG